MGDFIADYWQEGLFALLTAIFIATYKNLRKKLGDQKSIKSGVLALLRSDIIKAYDKYTAQGWIPIYALEAILAMYDSYHALGGNGTITKLVEELKELPSKDPNF